MADNGDSTSLAHELRNLDIDASHADLVIAGAFDRLGRRVRDLDGRMVAELQKIERRLFWQTTAMFTVAGAIIVALASAVVARGA